MLLHFFPLLFSDQLQCDLQIIFWIFSIESTSGYAQYDLDGVGIKQ